MKYLKDFLSGFAALGSLGRRVRIGPWSMSTFKEHAAHNAAAISVLAILLLISINYLSDAVAIDPIVAVLSAILSVFVIGILGFFVNLAAPADEFFDDDGNLDDESAALSNKWATLITIVFVVCLLLYFVTSLVFYLATGSVVLQYLNTQFMGAAPWQLKLSGVMAFVATAIVFGMSWMARRIVSDRPVAAMTFLATAAIVWALFYLFNFFFFS